MPLTKEQLLIPRVMCVGTEPGTPNYPGSMVKTGEILTLCTGITNGRYYESKDGHLIHLPLIYPNCFKPLQWWEHRKPDDMPEYVKYGHGAVYKIIEWRENKDYGIYAICERGEDYPLIMQPNTYPATREEYEEFLKQKEE